MRLLQRQNRDATTVACFDFCFIDGAHTWETDGVAFFLVDKLLRGDRWILLDDLHWTVAGSPSTKPGELKNVPDEEARTEQISKVYELLVRQHPWYRRFHELAGYGWAYKPGADDESHHEHDVQRLVGPELMRQLHDLRAHRGTGTELAG